MIENDRIIAADSLDGDEAIDRAMRPEKLEDYVGQPKVREQMDIFIQLRVDVKKHLIMFLSLGLLGLVKQHCHILLLTNLMSTCVILLGPY